MDESTLQGLTERFARLEHENRRLATGLLLIVAVTGGVLFLGSNQAKPTYRGKQIVARTYAVDIGGNPGGARAILGHMGAEKAVAEDEGIPVQLSLCDAGEPLATLELAQRRCLPHFVLHDRRNQRRAALRAWPGSDARLELTDREQELSYSAPPR